MSKELTPLQRALQSAESALENTGLAIGILTGTINHLNEVLPDPLDLPWTEDEVKAMGWSKEHSYTWPNATMFTKNGHIRVYVDGGSNYAGSHKPSNGRLDWRWLSWPTRRVWQAMQEGGQDK